MKKGKANLRSFRFSTFILIAFAIGFAVAGGYKLLNSHAVGGTANIWIDTDGGSCTRQTTAGPYSDTQACSDPNAAIS